MEIFVAYNIATLDTRLFFNSFLADHGLEQNSALNNLFSYDYFSLEEINNYSISDLLQYYIKNKQNCFFNFDKDSGLFSFLPSDKIQRVLEEFNLDKFYGAMASYSIENLYKVLNPFFNNRFRVSAKPVKTLRPLINLPEKSLVVFGELFEKFVQKINADISAIKIVSGEDIRAAYNGINYYSTKGTLADSCMRYAACQSFLDLYVKNPKQIQLAVYYIDGKVAGRCLIWDNKYYDRIYYHNDAVWQTMVRWAEVYNLIPIYRTNQDAEIKLDKTIFSQYPYMDSFRFIRSKNIISTRNGLLRLIYTDGSYSKQFRCVKCKDYHSIVKIVGYELLGVTGQRLKLRVISTCERCWDRHKYRKDAIYGYYIKARNAVYSNEYCGYILKEFATEKLTYKCHNCDNDLTLNNGITCPNCGKERTWYAS